MERLFAHRPIRDGLERILQGREGALIVLGTNLALGEISVDGLDLTAVSLDAARLAEVAKMDGAIILDNEWRVILTANAHLAPPPNIPTTESGARHRTAQRVAQITRLPVVTVSKDRAVVTLYINTEQVDLTPRWTIRKRILQHLQILVELRKRFDEADERLLRMELLGLVTAREVAHMVRMGEMVGRAATAIETMLADSVQDPSTTETLLADRVFEVERLVGLTLQDYLDDQAESARKKLAELPNHQLAHTWLVASELGLDKLEDGLVPRGNRLLYQTGVHSEHMKALLYGAYPDAQRMLHSSVEDFLEVKGIGIKSATRLRFGFDRLLASLHPIGQRTISELN
ncbi:MAG: DNA integrity scanning diadenylate cyclase DisA [bacterium]|nr:DNA integrity scanning diadenylate cyclase DisA [Acidimicrobiia bacterium]MCY4651105.1 DNA integrity scanning diadenylate cyclase DisA [bacterium]